MFNVFVPDNGNTPLVGMSFTINGNESGQIPLARFYSFVMDGTQFITFYNNDIAIALITMTAWFQPKTVQGEKPAVVGSPRKGGTSNVRWRDVHSPFIR